MTQDNDSIIGCLLGCAVGDALGLPLEGISKRRQHRMFKNIERHRFFFGKGMISDDTEHACMTAQSLIASHGGEKNFIRSLAWRLRFWMLGLPAGIGLATLRSLIKLWIGFPGDRSGVFSAGNGPAMRSAIIGVCCGNDIEKMRALARASTRITHTDPKAEFGALTVALAAYMSSKNGNEEAAPEEFSIEIEKMLEHENADEFIELMTKTTESVLEGNTTESFAEKLGLAKGVTGYMYHTIPVVIHAWLRHQRDFRGAMIEIIRCGGDTDTTAAILGGIVGARVGKDGIPTEWRDGICDWPRSVKWIERLGAALDESISSGKPHPAPRLSIAGILLRNIFFMIVVLLHGFRRLAPPY